MSAEDLTFSIGAVQTVVTMAVGVYAWIVGHRAASTKEINELRVAVAALTAQIELMPDQGAIIELRGDVSDVKSTQRASMTMMQGITQRINTINDFLMNLNRRG